MAATPHAAIRTTQLVVQTPARQVSLEIFDNPLSLDISRSILEGKTYPRVDCVQDVNVVVDVGANVGASSLYFTLLYPRARIFAFEPCPDVHRLLARNLAPFANVRTFDFGLFDRDCRAPLYLSNEDSVTNSVGSSYLNSDRSVSIELRAAGSACRALGLERIDVLKIDTEGCELPILHSLAGLAATAQVIYLEYHDEADRLAIDALLQPTHILIAAKLRHPHRGELCYVAYASFPSRAALDNLRIRRN